MNPTQIGVFQKTLEKSSQWIRNLQEILPEIDTEEAYQTLRVVLHTLRDHLTLDEIADLGAQMPMLIRGLYYEGWNPHHSLTKERSEWQLLKRISAYFKADQLLDLERRVNAVFQVLAAHVSAGEIKDILSVLPNELRKMWSL